MQVLMLIVFFGIVVVCFFAMKKIDIFIEKNTDCIDNTKRVNLIHLGFDAPYLAEDFVLRINDADRNHHTTETVIYTGSEKELMDMLLIGKLDYIILSHPVYDWDPKQGECTELYLQPQNVMSHVGELEINISATEAVKVNVYWIPRWIGTEKEYFSALLKMQSEC